MEMQQKIQLLEYDRSAENEDFQSTKKKNEELIRQLKQEIKKLQKQVHDADAGDEHVIKVALRAKGVEKDAYRSMSGKSALTKLDQRVLDKMKRLNALKHTTRTYQQRLEEMKTEHQRLKPESSRGAQSADAQRKEDDAKVSEPQTDNVRELENNLEKTQFKCKEAKNIKANYMKVKNHLQEEILTFHGQLDGLEAEILKHREELHNMQVMSQAAQLSKEAAKAELQQQEEKLCKERKERDRILASYRRKDEERKAQAEKIERRRTTMQPDELSSEAQRSTTRMAGEEEKVISTFEEAYRRISEATGVTDIQEILECFLSQKETHQHLEMLKEENENVLQQLKEQKELLNKQFQDMKYSGEAKLSRDQQMLEESEHQLQAQQQRRDAAAEQLSSLVKTYSNVRAGVEHLVDKLQHIALSEDTMAEVSPDSYEFVLELMTQYELKVQVLQEEVQGKDLTAIMKEMEEEEFSIRIEGELPSYNTRIKFLEEPGPGFSDDDDESKEDKSEVISREALKRQSQLIVDSTSKKKTWKKKGRP